ncbi:MAG: 4-diphosphocytidyl-2-C-methyl-D-erythritol kinase [Cyclobacteriaceae bacterium]|nr:MAG: 4-diphosphocytidyl-2-C-methyl-D-erythritol kinase [Cyclobacteriaceae bacterium]
MVLFPHAKINLGLQVIEKRRDGFHNIISCLYPVGWCDILEVLEAGKLTFKTSGLNIPGSPEQNLCLKAYNLIRELHDTPPVHIHLHKVIPIGAGLGGGSADAAYTLIALKRLFNLSITNVELVGLAAKLGGDCAFFVEGKPALATGKGDKLEPVEITLPTGYLVVVVPPVAVNTADAYGMIHPKPSENDLGRSLSQDPMDWQQLITNDFEDRVFKQFPIIEKLKETLLKKGAVYASLSGSGSSVFGIYKNKHDFGSWFPEDYKIWVEKL